MKLGAKTTILCVTFSTVDIITTHTQQVTTLLEPLCVRPAFVWTQTATHAWLLYSVRRDDIGNGPQWNNQKPSLDTL